MLNRFGSVLFVCSLVAWGRNAQAQSQDKPQASVGTPSVSAQQTTGVPGSPSATSTIDGRYLPPPEPKFGGVINLTAKDSKPYWPPTVVPPKGAPNVLLIMTDDQGYGVSGTFGGVIPTPAMDRIAKMGLRYTQFHSTALCSPTRAALITGRNHHSVGFGVIAEMSTGYPGYDSVIPPNSATVGKILKENGYATSWFGKNHNTPSYQYSLAGPYDQWAWAFSISMASWVAKPTSGRRFSSGTPPR
jgi:Sulfatase